jgi:broad specificity phosphatase PhoE
MRHAQSLGNVDELAYCRIPDHALPLTPQGEKEARKAGSAINELLIGKPVLIYASPYLRTLDTLRLLKIESQRDQVFIEPRLREQDWGNLQDPAEQKVHKRLRHEFGHFFYRLPFGESGADVDDRVTAFLSDLALDSRPDSTTLLIISHGLTIRLLCRRLFNWSIDLFESLSNLDTCEYRIVDFDGTQWTLNQPFKQWREAADGSTQTTVVSKH